MAAVRAEAMQATIPTAIFNQWIDESWGLSATSIRAAINPDIIANGIAKMVCENRTSSR